jgi:hypothetical protein
MISRFECFHVGNWIMVTSSLDHDLMRYDSKSLWFVAFVRCSLRHLAALCRSNSSVWHHRIRCIVFRASCMFTTREVEVLSMYNMMATNECSSDDNMTLPHNYLADPLNT